MNYEALIDRLIDLGEKEYVIYPYGQVGHRINEILLARGIEPVMIVDNGLQEERAVDRNVLRKTYRDSMCVIVATSDSEITDSIACELSEYVSYDKIVFVSHHIEYYGPSRILNRHIFDLKQLMPDALSDDFSSKIIKVRILDSGESNWVFIKGIYSAYFHMSNVDVMLLLQDNMQNSNNEKNIKNSGYTYAFQKDYSFYEDSPDITILTHPYHYTVWDGLRECSTLVIALPTSLINDSGRVYFALDLKESFGKYNPDYYVVDKLLYQSLLNSRTLDADMMLELGNPKYDEIYRGTLSSAIWEKIGKRRQCKTVLWAPDHGMTFNRQGIYMFGEVSFHIYSKAILNYARKYDINLIIRPHKLLFRELINMGVWGEEDYRKYIEYIDSTDNVILDENPTYVEAFSVADGIITDKSCGIIASSLPLDKPICAAYRSVNDMSVEENYIKECCYSVHNEDEMISFLDMVRLDNDPKRESRRKGIIKYVKHFDGNNSNRIAYKTIELLREKQHKNEFS